jgi:hypothetical protein
MMNTTIAQTLTDKQFKRRFGVQRETFNGMVKALQPEWRAAPKPGAYPKLALSDRILVTLEYWREYRTYFHISTNWGISESTVCRIVHWVENKLMQSGRFRLPGKQQLVRGFGSPSVVIGDVIETRIERPKRRQQIKLNATSTNCCNLYLRLLSNSSGVVCLTKRILQVLMKVLELLRSLLMVISKSRN